MPKILITGASGLLGRAVYEKFSKNSCFNLLGLVFSRVKDGMIKVNLLDEEKVTKVITDFKPDAIIHCAAERSPDKVEKDYEASQALNVSSSRTLAKLAGEINSAFLYISTDYVFDGKNPPYKESDEPNPLNKYGISKLEGEKEIMKVNPDSCILRIPVLYGDEEYVGESAISSLLKILLERSSIKTEVSNYEIRFPSCTNDIANICYELINHKFKDSSLKGIFHWCGNEALTKYEMTLIFAEEFGFSSSNIFPLNDPPADTHCLRPKNTQLSCDRLKSLGIGQYTNFKDGIKCFKTLVTLGSN